MDVQSEVTQDNLLALKVKPLLQAWHTEVIPLSVPQVLQPTMREQSGFTQLIEGGFVNTFILVHNVQTGAVFKALAEQVWQSTPQSPAGFTHPCPEGTRMPEHCTQRGAFPAGLGWQFVHPEPQTGNIQLSRLAWDIFPFIQASHWEVIPLAFALQNPVRQSGLHVGATHSDPLGTLLELHALQIGRVPAVLATHWPLLQLVSHTGEMHPLEPSGIKPELHAEHIDWVPAILAWQEPDLQLVEHEGIMQLMVWGIVGTFEFLQAVQIAAVPA